MVGRKMGMALHCFVFGSSASIPEVWEREAHGEGRGGGKVEGKGISLLSASDGPALSQGSQAL